MIIATSAILQVRFANIIFERCHFCHKDGHLSTVWGAKQSSTVNNVTSTVHALNNNDQDSLSINIRIKGKQFSFILDTGVPCNIISTDIWSKQTFPSASYYCIICYGISTINMWLIQLDSFGHINRWKRRILRPSLHVHQRRPQFVRDECFKCFKFDNLK